MTALQVYRDDGPLAEWLGRKLGPAMPVGEVPLTLLGALPLVAVLATAQGTVPVTALGLAVLGFGLLAGAGAGRPDASSFGWIVSPLLRLLEYAFLIRLTVLADPDALPLCFALLAVLAFHHYDTVYRLRHQRVAPPVWTRAAGGGWEGRLLIGYGLSVAGALGIGLVAAAVALAVIYVAESILSWVRFARAEQPALYDDDDLEED